MRIKRETADSLYALADKEGITVTQFDLAPLLSCSAQAPSGNCYIAIDPHFETTADERVRVAHELGHCVRGEFYNIYSRYDVRAKHERRADEWAIERLVGRRAFKKAIRSGCIEPWQIAEEFNITDAFAVKVMNYYLER